MDPGHSTAGELHSWGAAHGPLWDAIRAKGRRVEVIAIGAELDAVLRADRMLQLWAAAEPGKVATGLTVKQEISAIDKAIDNRDIEFLAQYGGMSEAGKRYMALQQLPEAELAEGSRLTTIRPTGQHGLPIRFDKPNPGCFSWYLEPLIFRYRDKGGGVPGKNVGCTGPTFLKLFCFLWFAVDIRIRE